ncbi:MAG: VPLPA-CTERM sorting domain-containing protein [Pseudomonadota bacterium]
MKALTKFASALLLALSPMGASAATFSNFAAIYDDANKLFEFHGTVETTSLSQFDEINISADVPFDFSGSDNPTFLDATIVTSSIGGILSISSVGRSFSIEDFNGAPAMAPFDFSLILFTPNGSNRFEEGSPNIILLDNSQPGSLFDRTENVGPVSLGATSIPLPAGGWLLLSGLGGLALLRRRTIVSNF